MEVNVGLIFLSNSDEKKSISHFTYAQFSEKLIILIPLDTHTDLSVSGGKKC